MKKIKDRILLGAITGIAVSAPLQIVDALIHWRKITDVSYGYSASRLFLKKKESKTPGGKAVSSIVNFINAALTATSIAYILSITGKDNAIVKGAGAGALMWVGLNGILSTAILGTKSKKPATPLSAFTLHLLLGALCSYVIIKTGDERLFPEEKYNNVSKQDKIPVFNTE